MYYNNIRWALNRLHRSGKIIGIDNTILTYLASASASFVVVSGSGRRQISIWILVALDGFFVHRNL